MKRRLIAWGRGRPARKWLSYTSTALFIIALASLDSGCKPKEGARLTTVYGEATDQAGQPVDSVRIVFAGHKGVSGPVPIKETYTDSTGAYQIVVDVPKKYSYASIVSSLDTELLRGKYSSQNRLIYRDGVEQNSCCTVTMGGKTNYDFVMLPK